MLKHNAAVYGVTANIEYVHSDAYVLLHHLITLQRDSISTRPPGRMIDVVVLAPPWGGSDYSASKSFDLHTMIPTGDMYTLISLAAQIASNIICILPRNTLKSQIEEISLTVDRSTHPCAVEDIYLWNKCKMTVAYFGLMFAKIPKLYLKRKLHLIEDIRSNDETAIPPSSNSLVGEISGICQSHIRFEE